MPLSRSAIRARAADFARDWAAAKDERSEAQPFWIAFLKVYGINARAVARFETPVRGLKGTQEYIDLLWPGTLLVEHKSRGKPLDAAREQAMGYVRALHDGGRAHEVPRYVIVCDFETIQIDHLETGATRTVAVADLHEHTDAFEFIAGLDRRTYDPEDPANLEAAGLLGDLHELVKAGGYPEDDLERFMVRVLFCLFAEDTFLFDEPSAFQHEIEENTREDGSDLGPAIARFFEVLNTPIERRQRGLSDRLAALPYVNGALYDGRLTFVNFDKAMREQLLACCRFKWATISPAVFGSLFQSIMKDTDRRAIGAHYTSERDILKLIDSLFMDALRHELHTAGTDKRKLARLHARLGTITVLDPACGCGNFLVIAYRELRKLEIEILLRLHPAGQQRVFDVRQELAVDLSQFYGIEIEPWPAKIAEVAMWLMDHQMNLEVSRVFGEPVVRLPLDSSATVVCGNALRLDWNELLPAERCSYVVGNPPFVGGKYQTKEQRDDMKLVWAGVKGAGLLDYVTAWYAKAADYLKGHTGRAALVSTNSITQGEQVGVVWNELFRRGITIDFGHRTFPWTSEARGKAHVHVVIVGFGHGDGPDTKRVYDYDATGEPLGVTAVGNVSPYLRDGANQGLENRRMPIVPVPAIGVGNKPIDGGYYLFNTQERDAFVRDEPGSAVFFRRWLGSKEMLHDIERWVLWLGEAEPSELRGLPRVMQQMQHVAEYRRGNIGPRKDPGKVPKKGRNADTVAMADQPRRFHVENIPAVRFLLIPRHYSQTYRYPPFALVDADRAMAGDACSVVADCSDFQLGVMISAMHAAWIEHVAGRIKSDYRYSGRLVYNNFPWPRPTDAQKAAVEAAAQAVLDARDNHPGSTLADLYDPLTMPADLAAAHAALDRAVDRCYRPQPFPDERRRFEFLFAEWERLTAPLAAPPKKKRRSAKSTPGA